MTPLELIYSESHPDYTVIYWPEVQEYMGFDWFKSEAILIDQTEEQPKSATYLIPNKYIVPWDLE